jgi:hypothetical protein
VNELGTKQGQVANTVEECTRQIEDSEETHELVLVDGPSSDIVSLSAGYATVKLEPVIETIARLGTKV